MNDLTALRDRLAGLCGWKFWSGARTSWWFKGTEKVQHPFQPNDLTALAAAWPEGWWWVRDMVWIAGRVGREVSFPDTGDEFADRLRLTVAVREAMGKEGE